MKELQAKIRKRGSYVGCEMKIYFIRFFIGFFKMGGSHGCSYA